MADQVLHQGVRGITDLMIMPGLINLDFADIRTVMSEMGKAMMGTGEASGERRAIEAAEKAIANPLLDEVSMRGAKGVIINITGGDDLRLHEVDEAATHIREMVDPDANIIVGSAFNPDLNGMMRVSVVATGIDVVARTPSIQTQRPAMFSRNSGSFDGPTVAVPGRTAPVAEPLPEPKAAVPAPEPEPVMPLSEPVMSDELDLAQAEMIEEETHPMVAQFTPKASTAAPVVQIRTPAPAPEPEEEPLSLFQKMLNLSRGTKPAPPRAPTTLAPEPDRQPEAGTDVEIPPFFRRQVNE